MGLLITAYLILTNMSISNHEFEASVFTAMDAWFVVCRLLVGGALFEFALLIKLSLKVDQKQNDIRGEFEKQCRVYDKIAFRAFNSALILFTLAYGIVCMSHH